MTQSIISNADPFSNYLLGPAYPLACGVEPDMSLTFSWKQLSVLFSPQVKSDMSDILANISA